MGRLVASGDEEESEQDIDGGKVTFIRKRGVLDCSELALAVRKNVSKMEI